MFNVEGLIKETVNILKTNKSNHEFILIDDGSCDRTYEVALNEIGADNRFLLFRKNNTGVSDTRNIGLNKSKGEYICFLDSDDLLTVGAIDNLYLTAKKNHADFVYFKIKKFNSSTEWVIPSHERNDVFSPGWKNITENKEIFWALGVGGKFIKRKIIENIKFPVEINYGEDTAFITKALIEAKKIFVIDDIFYYYRERDLSVHNPSATQQQDVFASKYFFDIVSSINICTDYIKKSKLVEVEKDIVLGFYYERMFAYEFKSLFFKAVNSKGNGSTQVLSTALIMLKNLSSSELEEIASIRYFFIRVFIDHIYKLSLRDFLLYRKILIRIMTSLSNGFYDKYDKKSFYDGRWTDAKKIAGKSIFLSIINFYKLSLKKRINYFLNKNSKTINHIVFEIAKNVFPLNSKKIIFATHKPSPISENMSDILRLVKKNNKILKFSGKSKLFRINVLRAYHFATAKYIFLEDYCSSIYGYKFRKEAKIIQLWHAAGAFKKFGISAIGLKDSNSFEFEKNAHSAYTNVYVSSAELIRIYADAFGIEKSKVKSLGVPRTDLFFNKKYMSEVAKKFIKTFPKDKKNILYAPTFRGNPSERSSFYINIDWSAIDKDFFENYRLIIKLHPVVKTIKNLPPDDFNESVIIAEKEISTNELMIYCDMLVTDYSSLIFEYALLDKPIIHYVYDIDSYYDERGFFFDFDAYKYGLVVKNDKDLFFNIKNHDFSNNNFEIERNEFINKFMASCDGNSAKRICDDIFLA